MTENKELKDRLYYSDLMYEIKSLAGVLEEDEENIEVDDRIWKRQEMSGEIHENGMVVYTISTFQEELFEIVSNISKRANKPFRSLGEIANYPKLVYDALAELEKKNEINNYLLDVIPSFYLGKKENAHSYDITSELEEKLINSGATTRIIDMFYDEEDIYSEIFGKNIKTIKLIRKK